MSRINRKNGYILNDHFKNLSNILEKKVSKFELIQKEILGIQPDKLILLYFKYKLEINLKY